MAPCRGLMYPRRDSGLARQTVMPTTSPTRAAVTVCRSAHYICTQCRSKLRSVWFHETAHVSLEGLRLNLHLLPQGRRSTLGTDATHLPHTQNLPRYTNRLEHPVTTRARLQQKHADQLATALQSTALLPQSKTLRTHSMLTLRPAVPVPVNARCTA